VPLLALRHSGLILLLLLLLALLLALLPALLLTALLLRPLWPLSRPRTTGA